MGGGSQYESESKKSPFLIFTLQSYIFFCLVDFERPMLSPIPKRVDVRDEVIDEGLGGGLDGGRRGGSGGGRGGGRGRGRPRGSKNRPKAERSAKTKGQVASIIQNFNNDV